MNLKKNPPKIITFQKKKTFNKKHKRCHAETVTLMN